MRLEDEIKTNKFQSETHKAQLNIMFTAGWMRARVLSSLKPFGLTPEQYNVLRIVRGQHPKSVCVKDISHRMLDRNSNTTRIIDKLEEKQLLQRTPSEHDRRERAITLTTAGQEILTRIDLKWENENPHHASLSLEEARELNFLLDKMRSIK